MSLTVNNSIKYAGNDLYKNTLSQPETTEPQEDSKPKTGIIYPLLETGNNHFEPRLFQQDIKSDAFYLGANRETVTINEQTVHLPRTLYHLFFLYFALKSGNDNKKYPSLEFFVPMHQLQEISSISSIDEKDYTETIDRFHSQLASFFKERNLTNLTWKDAKALLSEICTEFGSIYKELKDNLSEKCEQHLWYHFYRFCFFGIPEGPAKLEEVLLRALSLEWCSPADTEVLYRASILSSDQIVKDNQVPHSLSFGSSLFSGLIFEGTPTGTCPLVYYRNLVNQLYALVLSQSKVKKYFFYPPLFKSKGLLPLFARGEFSHPRLKIFSTEEQRISGVQGRWEEAKELAVFAPTEKIPHLKAYQEKMIRIFQKSICILGI